jgi:hypothetical protein
VSSPRSRRALTEGACVLLFLAVAIVATRPLALHLGTRTLASGDPIVDLWTIHWLVEHFFEAGRVFQGNTFFPAQHAVLFSDLTLGTVALLLPLRPLHLDPVTLYGVALLVTLAFAGWAFHALALEVTGHRAASLACGILAAFGSHQTSHVYHVNLLAVGWLALFVRGLLRLRRGSSGAQVALTGVAFALCAQSSGYYAVVATLLSFVFACVAWRDVLPAWRRYAAAAALGTLLTAPYLVAYGGVRAEQGLQRPVGMSAAMAFHPTRDLGSNALVYAPLLGRGGERLFPGLLTLLLVAAVLRRRPWPADIRFLAAASAALLLLSLGPWLAVGSVRVPLPYLWLRVVPALASMRHPYTFAAVAVMLLAVLAAQGFASLGVAQRRGAGALLVALAALETLAPAPDLQAVPAGLPAHYAEVLDQLPEGPILEVPLFAEDSLVSAARHGRAMANGQGSAFVPLDTLRLDRMIRNHWLTTTPEDVDRTKATRYLLKHVPVRYVVLPGVRRDQLRGLADAFSRSRVFVKIGKSSDGGIVYEVHPESAPPDDAGAAEDDEP